MASESNDRWHTLSTEKVLEKLDSSSRGLSSDEAARRFKAFGPNELEEGKKLSKMGLLIEQVKNPLIAVLSLAAAISFLADKMVDSAVIIAVICINTALGFFKEYKAEEAILALRSQASAEARVLRDCPLKGACQEMRIKSQEVVPGDIILVEAGAKVPADARIIEQANLEVDESMLTGESVPARKRVETLEGDLVVVERDNIIFAGTVVTQGRCKAAVFATGMKSEMGNIAHQINKTKKAKTPLKRRTLDLSKKLMILALIASSLTLVIGMWRGFDLIELFLFTLAMAVSAIPEGLPAAITVALAVGVSRMASRHAIIRKLEAVETLGSITAVCTDKTGTLTTNQMTVQKIFLAGRMVEVSGVGFQPEGSFEMDGVQLNASEDVSLAMFLKIAALCNDATLKSHKEENDRWEILGDPTEGALVVASAKAGLQKSELDESYQRVDEIPFDPKNRYMATFHRTASGDTLALLKGAPETVLDMCSRVLDNGEIRVLSQEEKKDYLAASSQMAGEALRVLALAYAAISAEKMEAFRNNGPADLIFSGFSGMIDPPRPEAIRSVELCKRAGIKVTMATGDHQITAQAIGEMIGIYKEGSRVLTGSDMDGLSDEELDALIQDTSVFARVSPKHKHRIVQSLQRRGHIVAMTGDGVNDAPALKAAEIGIAMGITGTDVTKETADMILTDDNFQSILNAVEEGRVIFENIRKVVKYLISTNAGEILTILVSLIFLAINVLIFTPVQILWVNLVTDGLLVINLAMEPKEEDVMDQPPRSPKANIINMDILKNILFVAAFMAAGTLWVFTSELSAEGIHKAQTLGFSTLAMFQIFNALNCRSQDKSVFKIGLFSNKYLIVGIAASIALQFMATELAFFQMALGTVELSFHEWAIIFVVSSTVFIAEEIRKLVMERTKARTS
jgi:Ca2+-transporting ATPase